jgi:hypothetical protein
MDPESVETHRLEDVIALHSHKTTMDISSGEGIDVPGMQTLGGGVWERHRVIIWSSGMGEIHGMDFGGSQRTCRFLSTTR